MPRLTSASRLARRTAIAEAALRVFERRGVAHASTAEIIEELGGSAGGVYSHFDSKAGLIRFLAEQVLSNGFEAIAEAAPAGSAPAVVLRGALRDLSGAAPAAVVLQLWGEASIDPEMRAVVHDTLTRVESSFRTAVLPWASSQPGDPDARAARAGRAMRAIAQGYLVQLALTGHWPADEYLDALTAVLDATD